MRGASTASSIVVLMATTACGPGSTLGTTEPAGGPAAQHLRIEKEAAESETAGSVSQAPEPRTDRSLAPYLWVPGATGDVDLLPLEKTAAKVEIAGVIAHVTVTQVFSNEGKVPIEAEYVFPGSTRAAVHGMTMRIGDRTVVAKIEEREEAKVIYEAAKAEGKVASLLQEERRNVFTMRVANIMPGARIEVELEYSEMLVPEEGRYEFVYPTVVGPRYGGGAAGGGGVDPVEDKWIETPYTPSATPGAAAPYDFSIGIDLRAAMPLVGVSSPSDVLDAVYWSESSVHLEPVEAKGDHDVVIRWSLADEAIESGMLVLPEGAGGYFAIMMEPPPRPRPDQVVPREYVFVMDVSGSMAGFPIGTERKLMQDLLAGLGPEDRFDLILFAGTSYKLSEESLPAIPENVSLAMDAITNVPAGGGTELVAALRSAYEIPDTDRMSRIVVVATDGFVGVEAQAFRFIRENLGRASLFAFGIGTSVNRDLIESMARAGMGEPFVVLGPEEAPAEAERFREYVGAPVLTDVTVRFDGFAASEVLPDPAAIPDVLASRPVVLVGRYSGPVGGKVTLAGVTGEGDYSATYDLAAIASGEGTDPLRVLWARRWVDLWEDELKIAPTEYDLLVKKIVKLGLEHSILTSQTSFVAVDSEVVNKTGQVEGVDQPLPLPEGVAASAVGGSDADADRIPDGNDSCPGDPETYNGFQDQDGCPDYGKIEIAPCSIVVMDKIYFDKGSTKIKDVAFDLLDAVAATINGNPQLALIQIAGHADSIEAMAGKKKGKKGAAGGPDPAVALSIARAQAVVDYLVGKGVDPKKLVVAGYGSECPVDTGKGEGAWEKNRRAEFKILETDNGPTNVEFACQAAIDKGLVPEPLLKYLPPPAGPAK